MLVIEQALVKGVFFYFESLFSMGKSSLVIIRGRVLAFLLLGWRVLFRVSV